MATKKKKNARRRDGMPVDYWRQHARPLSLGDERFRLTLVQSNGKTLPITDQTTGFTWDDASTELSGSLTLSEQPMHVTVNQTYKIRCEWSPALQGKFARLWTMKVATPNPQLSAATSALDLSSKLSDVRKSRDDYRFKKDRAHPNGWTADQIAVFVARKVGVKLGRVAKCTHHITNLVQKQADPIDVIVKAYRAERQATGRRFFLSWEGQLNIDPLRRGPYLLNLAGALIDASYKSTLKDTFATSLTVTATAKAAADHKPASKGGGRRTSKTRRRKIRVTVQSASGVRSYGYVHRTIGAPHAHSEEDARTYAKRILARNMKPTQELEVTVPIMPSLRRGEAFRVLWKSVGLTQIVFVGAVTHTVAPSGSTSQITAVFTDPYVDSKADKAAKQRAAAARRRGRVKVSDSGPAKATGRKGKRRSDS